MFFRIIRKCFSAIRDPSVRSYTPGKWLEEPKVLRRQDISRRWICNEPRSFRQHWNEEKANILSLKPVDLIINNRWILTCWTRQCLASRLCREAASAHWFRHSLPRPTVADNRSRPEINKKKVGKWQRKKKSGRNNFSLKILDVLFVQKVSFVFGNKTFWSVRSLNAYLVCVVLFLASLAFPPSWLAAAVQITIDKLFYSCIYSGFVWIVRLKHCIFLYKLKNQKGHTIN